MNQHFYPPFPREIPLTSSKFVKKYHVGGLWDLGSFSPAKLDHACIFDINYLLIVSMHLTVSSCMHYLVPGMVIFQVAL